MNVSPLPHAGAAFAAPATAQSPRAVVCARHAISQPGPLCTCAPPIARAQAFDGVDASKISLKDLQVCG